MRQWVRRLWLVVVLLLPGVAGAGDVVPLPRDEESAIRLARDVLGRDDVRLETGRYMVVPARDGEPVTGYRVRDCGRYQLPGGATAHAMTFEDELARRAQDDLFFQGHDERPELPPYRGYFLGVSRIESDGSIRAVRLEIPPQAVFAELAGCGDPRQAPEGDWLLPLRHTALLFEPGITRRIFFESSYSLVSMTLVNQREISEQRYHIATRELEGFQYGQLVKMEVIDEADDPRAGFLVTGMVVDEFGERAANVAVQVRWTEWIPISAVETETKGKTASSQTDREGLFRQRVRYTRIADVDLYRRGYLPGFYQVYIEAPSPKTMQLVPLPVGRVSERDLHRGGGRGRGELGELVDTRGVGFSFDLGSGPHPSVQGWTRDRNQADLWFEISDPHFEEKLKEHVEAKGQRGLDRLWTEGHGFEMTLYGLRGTEFAPIPYGEEEGLSKTFQYREAPISGYVSKLTGLLPERRDPRQDMPAGSLPTRFYLRKNGCYGKLIGLEFSLRSSRQKVNGRLRSDLPRELYWKVELDQFALQARPLGNRLLFVTDEKSVVPPFILYKRP